MKSEKAIRKKLKEAKDDVKNYNNLMRTYRTYIELHHRDLAKERVETLRWVLSNDD